MRSADQQHSRLMAAIDPHAAATGADPFNQDKRQRIESARRRNGIGKAGRKGAFLVRHLPSEEVVESIRSVGDPSDPEQAAQVTANPGVAPDSGKPDDLVAAIGDLLLSEWMAENLPILRKRALTPVRTAANTPGQDWASEDAA